MKKEKKVAPEFIMVFGKKAKRLVVWENGDARYALPARNGSETWIVFRSRDGKFRCEIPGTKSFMDTPEDTVLEAGDALRKEFKKRIDKYEREFIRSWNNLHIPEKWSRLQ